MQCFGIAILFLSCFFELNLEEIIVIINTMMQETANENAVGVGRICKRSDQPKVEI